MPVYEGAVHSPTLGEAIAYRAYVVGEGADLPWGLLLHGRTGASADWDEVLPSLEAAALPPFLGIAVDAPWLERSSFYTDSAYRDGQAVETALVRDLVPHVSREWPVAVERSARLVAGYSMGGAGALRLALRYPELFGGLVALSPATYFPLPPPDSNTRPFGAFGRGHVVFDEDAYRAWHHSSLPPSGLPLRAFVAAGTDESLRVEASVVASDLRSRPGVEVAHHTYPGGHTFEVWRPALVDGLRFVLG
jgi:enterochelin esterase-like enzyme